MSSTNMSSKQSTVASLAAKGVAEPLLVALLQYQAAVDSGLPEPSARLVFCDHFLEAKSPLHRYTDDMVWVVRGVRSSSLQTFVSLLRRGSTDAQALLDEAARESDDLGGSMDFGSTLGGTTGGSVELAGTDSPLRRNSVADEAEAETGSQRLLRMLSDSLTPMSKRRRPPPTLWQETLALNLVTQWKFTLTVAVTKFCTVDGKQEMVAVRREVHRVFGQPTRTVFSSDKEGRGSDGDLLDYPNIYFNVENFDQGAFRDIQLSDGYNLAVLLTAGDEQTDSNATLFRGVLSYETIMARVVKKARENKYIPTEERKEFIPLLGPERKGKAEIAVSISEADVQILQQQQQQQQGVTKGDGRGGSSPERGFLDSILKKKDALKGKGANGGTLRGDEILQCCLTFVCMPIHHVVHVLLSSDRAHARQWLYVPRDREELDRMLEAQLTLEAATAAKNAAGHTPSSPNVASSPTSETQVEGGGLFAALKRRFT